MKATSELCAKFGFDVQRALRLDVAKSQSNSGHVSYPHPTAMGLTKVLYLLLCTACYQFAVVGHGIVPNTWEAGVAKLSVKQNPVVTLASTLCNVRKHFFVLSLTTLTTVVSQFLAWVAVACTGFSWYFSDTHHDSLWPNKLCPLPVDGDIRQSITSSGGTSLSFFVGVALCILGATTKALSQRTLGYLYNSSLNLRPAHRLVMDGPYGYVRHPGYSGAILSVIGLTLAHSAQPSYFTMCGIMKVGYARLVWTWIIWSGAWCLSLIVRATKEDKVLAERFGVEWKHWNWRVPKRFIPWIL